MHSSSKKLPRIVMWHGGRQWDGAADIHPGRKGRNERAPGIYCTTHFLSAQKNARGWSGSQARTGAALAA